MNKEIDLILSPKDASSEDFYLQHAARALQIHPKSITYTQITRRSIDARRPPVKVNLRLQVYFDERPPEPRSVCFEYPDVSHKSEAHIIGAGPAGLFCALRFIELGIKPVILERGKAVRERRKDIAAINREQRINPDSNYCFGEGGAGAFSDGKLYTRSKKRGNVQKILEVFHFHGASQDILIDAHPHIGTNKLPAIIESIRQTVLDAGGEIHFNTRIEDIVVQNQRITAIITQTGTRIDANTLILAVGHSARNIFELLHRRNIVIHAKPFAMGVRIEHPQQLIDRIQYHCTDRSRYLPAASYSQAVQVAGRGVYAFCMCPGGFIVPAATSDQEIVVNGMSPALRNSRFANSGLVVEIRLEDLQDYDRFGPLAGVKYQQHVEQLAKQNGGCGQIAPAQRMIDFVEGRWSKDLPQSSYRPGTASSALHQWLPEHIGRRLQKGLGDFNRKMRGYLTNEAVLLGVESRTSSPVRIPRCPETLQHVQIENLFPCGEGAGYAGGIVSSAVDGECCAEAAARQIFSGSLPADPIP
jgi:uncharacterized FAD-dependent dehydrogenase